MRRRSLLYGLATTFILPLGACGLGHASDRQMISWFRKNEDLFNRLVGMARSEPIVRRIAADFLKTEMETFNYPQTPGGFTVERWNDYRKLFKLLRLEMGIEFWNRDAVWLHATSLGIVVSGSTKGYVWSTRSLEPLVSSLDPPLPAEGELPGDDYIAYRAIDESWYLALEMS